MRRVCVIVRERERERERERRIHIVSERHLLIEVPTYDLAVFDKDFRYNTWVDGRTLNR